MATYVLDGAVTPSSFQPQGGLLCSDPECQKVLANLESLGVRSVRLFYRDLLGYGPMVHAYDIEPHAGVRMTARWLQQVNSTCERFVDLLQDVFEAANQSTAAAGIDLLAQVYITLTPTRTMTAHVAGVQVVADFYSHHSLSLV
jgi:hypothetical protein